MSVDIKVLQRQIAELEKSIAEETSIKNQLEGRLQSLKEQLKKDFGCVSTEEAQKRIETFNVEINSLEQEEAALKKSLDELLVKK